MKSSKRTREVKECLRILQEEGAEVIQAISKVFRFGEDSKFPYPNSLSNVESLHMEIGDFIAMVDILVDKGYLNMDIIDEAIQNKKDRLHKWSNIKV
jgi:NTP pyrophosphatase (non-canonical NTP hydrolase)